MTCDVEEAVVSVDGVDVDGEEEAADHTGLALEPEDRSFGEGQPNTTDAK